MVKWSRVRLILSILTCEGLFETLRERLQFAPRPRKSAEHLLPAPWHDYAGALHIHSTYSDGVGTVEEIADAANRAGLDYFVLCDHNNLDPLTHGQTGWHGRTLILAGTEITTDTGHLLALNVPPAFVPSPFEAVQAQQAIQNAGGIGFIALPCDLKGHWRDFSVRQRGIGLEVFNLSAIARTKISLPGLLLVWRRYKSRHRMKAFHLVSARPGREIALWDRLMQPSEPGGAWEPVVGIASLDAHAVMRFGGRSYPYPTYEESFRTLRTHVVMDEPLLQSSGADDARRVHQALADGHCYMSYDNYADPSGFRFEAHAAEGANWFAPMGAALSMTDAPNGIRLDAYSPRPNSLLRLFHNGIVVAASQGGRLSCHVRQPGAYRVEVYLYRFSVGRLCVSSKPWVFSNPIYLQPAPAPASPDASVLPARQTSADLTSI